jgi:hypothetical protein
MSTWISKHLATCFFIVIGVIIFLATVFNISLANTRKLINAKADTLLINRAFESIQFSVMDMSIKQDTIIKNQNILIQLSHAGK